MSGFSRRLRELRLEKKITLEKMAEDLKTTKASLSRYENSKRDPKSEIVNMFADYFNVSVDYLLGKTDSKEIKLVTHNIDGYETVVALAKDKKITPDELRNLLNVIEKMKGT